MTDMILVEPSDGEFVRTGDKWPFTFWQRDDQAAEETEYGDAHWWDCGDENADENGPVSWEDITRMTDPQLVEFSPLWRAPRPKRVVRCPHAGCDVTTEYEAEMDAHVLTCPPVRAAESSVSTTRDVDQ